MLGMFPMVSPAVDGSGGPLVPGLRQTSNR